LDGVVGQDRAAPNDGHRRVPCDASLIEIVLVMQAAIPAV
jgi:hypothetical protein